MIITTIDPSELALVVGGQNVDKYSKKLTVQMVEDIPVPYYREKTEKVRTPYGQCLDDAKARCERIGGSNDTVGSCTLAGIQACPQQ